MIILGSSVVKVEGLLEKLPSLYDVVISILVVFEFIFNLFIFFYPCHYCKKFNHQFIENKEGYELSWIDPPHHRSSNSSLIPNLLELVDVIFLLARYIDAIFHICLVLREKLFNFLVLCK